MKLTHLCFVIWFFLAPAFPMIVTKGASTSAIAAEAASVVKPLTSETLDSCRHEVGLLTTSLTLASTGVRYSWGNRTALWHVSLLSGDVTGVNSSGPVESTSVYDTLTQKYSGASSTPHSSINFAFRTGIEWRQALNSMSTFSWGLEAQGDIRWMKEKDSQSVTAADSNVQGFNFTNTYTTTQYTASIAVPLQIHFTPVSQIQISAEIGPSIGYVFGKRITESVEVRTSYSVTRSMTENLSGYVLKMNWNRVMFCVAYVF